VYLPGRDRVDHPNRTDTPMFKLFWHAGVFAIVTFVVYLVCMMFVRIENQRQAARGRRNS
jgi:hypothetical protein